MKQINVPVEDETYALAKVAARESGMLFRKWIEKAIRGAMVTNDGTAKKEKNQC